MFRRLLSGALAAAALLASFGAGGVASAAPAPPEGSTHADPYLSPHAFFIKGSNGFDIIVAAGRSDRSGHGQIYIEAKGPTGTVRYSVRGDVAHEGIKANFGRFGRVDMRWVPNGSVRRIHGTCEGYPWSRYLDAGAYVGSLRFRGGGGFTEARTKRVVWRRKWYGRHAVCGVGISEGSPGPGKFLKVNLIHGGPNSPNLSVFQKGPGQKVVCGAWATYRLGRITVSREAFASGKASTLTVPSSFKTGELSPPAPFSGTGRFERAEHAKGTWLGDLSVEFPDGFVQRLAGPAYEARLQSGFREVEEEP